MNYLIIFNHPFKGSYCNALLDAVQEGLKTAQHSMDLIHLDNEQFNPVMTAEDLKSFRDKKPSDRQVIAYQQRLEKADYLVFIFPIWWELMPALMKGFIDKVIFPGLAYDYANDKNTRMKPLLNNIKGVTVITTMNTPRYIYRWIFGNAIQKAFMRGIFWKLGYKNRKWISYNRVKMVSQSKRENWLDELEKKFSKL
ncbi:MULTISPECIES: NAD(P)H-dependent oxidoreductase [unclassified Flavobacterium]|jgi:NAD(P)H dehydrogenase (quinone)|uniref:NAD(P)H-dependent oxidoreductase n=1 Tax=unclassified Flavobacterium TaxID=196869 RepID=UPI00057E344D|nr:MULTISPECIES: NAD(P)H-dependent oxidoreductase [unclassified Flavobacterium]KIA98787.1 NADPH-quinone reductase [Flavobacterium sp. KMS]KIC03598.1 NADPH-quinone reductase [Flavobacterium sp. JRM]MEA9412007.1 NAD(P)H-dependent oxidoreductase [Flavobacterium sp. PL02]OUL63284.1 NADPH:quinone reductase [Flavobacterium sp. AJR]